MKKILIFLCFLLFNVCDVLGNEILYKETIFNSTNNSKGISSYTDSWYNVTNGFRINIINANNNNNQWNYIKFGRKNVSSSGTIITNSSIDKKITKICITIDALTVSKINNVSLYVSNNGNVWTFCNTFSKSVGTQCVEIDNIKQAENLYYKITFDCQSGSSNGLIQISHLYFYINEDEPTVPCDSVSISLLATTNGIASLNKNKLCPGDEVEVSYTPNEGYMLDKILVNGVESSSTVVITENSTIQVLFKELPPEPYIDVVEWNPNYIKVDIDDFNGVTAIIENQNTQEIHNENVADEIFFSKYFEAKGNVKLIGIYNGTSDTINLKEYQLGTAQNTNFVYKKFSEFKLNDDNTISLNKLILPPQKEIIFISYNDADSTLIKCAKENKKSGFENFIRIKNPKLEFNGDDAVSLLNPNGQLIDLIGAGNKTSRNTTHANNKDDSFMDYNGWINTNGVDITTDTSNYTLSTNRCLLIRKNTVKSGYIAVEKNTEDFVTLGGEFGEWMGLQIPGKDEEGNVTSCHGFDYVGSYNYNEYYAQFDTIIKPTLLSSILQDDGTYKFNLPYLDTLSCTNLKIIAKDNESNVAEQTFKIPIMVTKDTLINSPLFTKEGEDCKTCDVVILSNSSLTVNDNSWNKNRDVKVYENGRLIIPDGKEYTVNTLSLRRKNNDVSYFSLKGNLVIEQDSGLYFDLYTDADDWRWIALPDTFNTKDIKLKNNKRATINTDYMIGYYDGEYRSKYYSGGWKYCTEDTIFNSGEGFIFGINLPNKYKKQFLFKFSNNLIKEEKNNKTVGNLTAWGCDNENLRPNHKGWNIIGNPFMDGDTTDILTPVRIGRLVKLFNNGNWTGEWEVDSIVNKLRYAVVPSKADEDIAAGGYKSVVLDDVELKPFTSFFIQIGGNPSDNQSLLFNNSKRRNIPRKILSDYDEVLEEDKEVFLRIKIDNFKTGFFISDKFTEEYEPGDDLESRYPIYQLINDNKLLYSAIPEETLMNGVDVYCKKGHLLLDTKTDKSLFEEIWIYCDNNWFDLFNDTEIDLPVDNFVIFARLKRESGIVTNDNIINNKYEDNFRMYNVLGLPVNEDYKGVIIKGNKKLLIK